MFLQIFGSYHLLCLLRQPVPINLMISYLIRILNLFLFSTSRVEKSLFKDTLGKHAARWQPELQLLKVIGKLLTSLNLKWKKKRCHLPLPIFTACHFNCLLPLLLYHSLSLLLLSLATFDKYLNLIEVTLHPNSFPYFLYPLSKFLHQSI